MSSLSSTVDLTDVDLFARGEHHAVLAELRRNSPVHWNAGPDGGFWALTRYDDVVNGYRDHATFSSARGAILGSSFRGAGDSAAGRMLVATDLPRHRMLRQAAHPAFGSGPTERIRRQTELLVDRALDGLVADGGGDFVTDVAIMLPAGALMAMTGIEFDQAVELIGMTRRMIGYREGSTGPESESGERFRIALAQSEIFGFFSELVHERRDRPDGDLIEVLTSAQLNGRPMSEADVLYNLLNVAVGGNETSSFSACAGAEVFMQEPEQYERLVADPSLLESAVEEVLRWSSTNAYVRRALTRDIELHGTVLRSGDSVTLWNVSANRDEAQFPDAARFDIGRRPNRHMSLGAGTHRCIGATVGQAELRTVFGRMAARGIRLEPAGPAVRLRSNFILGFTSLPVRVVVA